MLAHGPFHSFRRLVLCLVVLNLGSSAVFADPAPKGTLEPITTLSMDAAAREAPRVVRKSDSLLNGALIGAGAAFGAGLFICMRMEPWSVCRDDAARFGAIGAAIGAGVDALIRRQVTIYENPNGTTLHAAPILGRRARGVRLSVTF